MHYNCIRNEIRQKKIDVLKPQTLVPRYFLGIYRRNYEEISIRRNILMKYRGKMYSSEKTDEFRGYIIAVREPLGDFKNSEEIPTN